MRASVFRFSMKRIKHKIKTLFQAVHNVCKVYVLVCMISMHQHLIYNAIEFREQNFKHKPIAILMENI